MNILKCLSSFLVVILSARSDETTLSKTIHSLNFQCDHCNIIFKKTLNKNLSLETIINKGQSNTVNIEKDAHTLWINSNKNNDTKVTYTFYVPEKKYFSDLSVQGFSIQVKADDNFGFKSIQIKGNKLVDSHIHGSFYQLSLHCNKVKNSHIYWTGGLDQSLGMKYALNRADNFYLYLTKNIPYSLHGYERNMLYNESGVNIYGECRKGSGLIIKKL